MACHHAAMQPPLDELDASLFGARCALHPEALASIICARCGSYACASCESRRSDGRGYCTRCVSVAPLPAERGSRLAAHLIDAVALYLPLILVFAVLLGLQVHRDTAALWGGLGLSTMAMLAVVVYQCVLVHQRGQTLGKRMVGIRMVRANGSRLELWRFILLRTLVPAVINASCGLFNLVDALFIFQDSRCCLHDLLADTRVVKADESQP